MMIITKVKDRIEQAAGRAVPRPRGKDTDLIEFVPKSRMPEDMPVSRGIRVNAAFPAGRVLVVKTDEPARIRACYRKRRNLANMDGMGTSGIDVYRRKEDGFTYLKTVYPIRRNAMYAEGYIEEAGELHLLLPSYASLEHLFISAGEPVLCGHGDRDKKVVCYGSSITQGCAASRPGKNYVNQMYLDGYDTVNYGFSESARGETEVIKHIAKEYADIYILEYDHNASVEELRATHRKVYRTIRALNPVSMIIFMSRMSGGISITKEEEKERIRIIEATVNAAHEEGDENTFFICGETEDAEKYLADDRHPIDAGMDLIKRRIADCVRADS